MTSINTSTSSQRLAILTLGSSVGGSSSRLALKTMLAAEVTEVADPDWLESGHAFIGRRVDRSCEDQKISRGHIFAWLPTTANDPYLDESDEPAPLFKVRFFSGELSGDVEDLDIRQVVESLVVVTSPSKAPAAPSSEPPVGSAAPEATAEDSEDDASNSSDDDDDRSAPPTRRKMKRLTRRKIHASDSDESLKPTRSDGDDDDDDGRSALPTGKKRRNPSPTTEDDGIYVFCPDFDEQLAFAIENHGTANLEEMRAAADAATDPRQANVFRSIIDAVSTALQSDRDMEASLKRRRTVPKAEDGDSEEDLPRCKVEGGTADSEASGSETSGLEDEKRP